MLFPKHGLGTVWPLLKLRATLQQAVKQGSVHVVDAGAGRTLAEVKTTVRHELHHRYETNLSPAAAREFMADPLAHLAGRTLVDDRDYPDELVELASEIGAHLAAGQWKDLGLTT